MNAPETTTDYVRLLDYIQEEDLGDPLMVFGGIEENFDRRLNRENLAYINANRKLLQKIQSRLSGDHLRWQLSTSFKQVLVVPEQRAEYAQLFEQYCREAVDFLLSRIHQPNPYRTIATLTGPLPDPRQTEQDGIAAYLVHNIADEYIEEYLFFDQENDQAKVKIKLSNREFDGKIGSYTSKLKIGAENQFEFIREPFTVWQNSAQNPYNVLIVPIEETLHIILRSATEQAMREELTRLNPEKLQEVQSVLNYWMAVEEAVVGGLVWQIMPDLLDHVTKGISAFPMAQTMAERHSHEQYRFLGKGIDLVTRLGVDESIQLYQTSAKEFQTRLNEAKPEINSPGIS
ncbi:MAG: hypothetical protein P8X96_02830 [Desulfobacteraceae bacterium]|jgi:hypothetical protein